jgi:hypothetical protein
MQLIVVAGIWAIVRFMKVIQSQIINVVSLQTIYNTGYDVVSVNYQDTSASLEARIMQKINTFPNRTGPYQIISNHIVWDGLPADPLTSDPAMTILTGRGMITPYVEARHMRDHIRIIYGPVRQGSGTNNQGAKTNTDKPDGGEDKTGDQNPSKTPSKSGPVEAGPSEKKRKTPPT